MVSAPSGTSEAGGLGESDLPSSSFDAPDNPYSDSMDESNLSAPSKNLDNPFKAPSAATKSLNQGILGGEIVPTAVGFEDIWTPAWQCWQANMGLMVGCVATVGGINIFFSIVNQILGAVLAEVNSPEILLGLIFLISVISGIIQLYLGIGVVKICLKLLRRQQTGFGELFSGANKIFPVFVAALLFGIASFFGFLLLIVPGVFIVLLFWTYHYLIIDNRAGIFDSFSAALKIGSINKLTSFVMFLSAMALAVLGTLMCYVGLLFTAGLVYMLYASAYLKMTGQLR